MPIQRRLTPQERLKKKLPKGYRACLRHDLLRKIANGVFVPTAPNIVQAIDKTTKWKGASWAEKVFVVALDQILEKSGRKGILPVDTYNRLHEHLLSNEGKMQASDPRAWHIWCWDIYNDFYGLDDMEPGDLNLPEPPRPVRKPAKKKPRKRLRKHG